VLTVANFNMHAGIDGWGRPFDYVAACRALDADVLVLEETWASTGVPAEEGQAEHIAAELGYQVVTAPLGDGYRIAPQAGAPDSWMPRLAFADRHKSLYFECVRPLSNRTKRSTRFLESDHGVFGIAVLVRPGLALEASRVLAFPTLGRDRVRRGAIVVDLTVEGTPLSVVGTHMAHMHQGSGGHFRLLRSQLSSEARPNAVLAGDMNTWPPMVRRVLRGWRPAVRGASWPTWRPHSQIDHILVRGAVQPVSGEVRPDAGSDHRPVRAVLSVG
jgi:endonuclease/exonuclease/phosphatase family metal-dependent hydrolase